MTHPDPGPGTPTAPSGATAPAGPDAARPGPAPVVVFAAMAEEAAPFVAAAERVGEPTRVGPAEVRELVLAGRPVVLARTGIGLVNAAASAAAVLAATGASAAVSAGTAGGLPGTQVGDVVVGTAYRYTDADATAFGYAPGQVPGMPERYETGGTLVAALTDLTGDAPTAQVAGLPVRVGEMVAGDSFVTAANVEPVRARFPAALSVDMETTALAQVAHLFGVPFVSVRGVSDLCGPAGADDHLTHVDDAAERSARVVIALLRNL